LAEGNEQQPQQNQKDSTQSVATKAQQKVKQEGSGKYDIVREDEDTIIKIDYTDAYTIPSIEDNGHCMSRVIEILTQVKNATKIIFFQKRDYEYDFTQTRILEEIAQLYTTFIKEKKIACSITYWFLLQELLQDNDILSYKNYYLIP
jgi:hypothetical protein